MEMETQAYVHGYDSKEGAHCVLHDKTHYNTKADFFLHYSLVNKCRQPSTSLELFLLKAVIEMSVTLSVNGDMLKVNVKIGYV